MTSIVLFPLCTLFRVQWQDCQTRKICPPIHFQSQCPLFFFSTSFLAQPQ